MNRYEAMFTLVGLLINIEPVDLLTGIMMVTLLNKTMVAIIHMTLYTMMTFIHLSLL